MSMQDAVAFLRAARYDEALARAVDELDDHATWESLGEAAARSGFDFTPSELRRAHALDWALRWARYHGSR
jgi:hypothetical protein